MTTPRTLLATILASLLVLTLPSAANAKAPHRRHHPAHRSAAAANDYTLFTYLGRTFRWDPCGGPISVTWDTDTSGALDTQRTALITKAIRLLKRATGLPLVLVGPGPKPEHGIWIRWTTAADDPDLAGLPIGMGGPDTADWDVAPGVNEIETASVSLDEEVPGDFYLGFGRGHSIGALLLHELGHAVGLDHAHDPRAEVMSAAQYLDAPATYQAGDLAGLRAVGAAAGCLPPVDATRAASNRLASDSR